MADCALTYCDATIAKSLRALCTSKEVNAGGPNTSQRCWHPSATEVHTFLGRRTGQRAIVNVRGDLIVRPLPLEQRLLSTNLFGLGRLKDHFLSEYLKSLLLIMEGQFRGKNAPGGAAGVVTILQASNGFGNFFHVFLTTVSNDWRFSYFRQNFRGHQVGMRLDPAGMKHRDVIWQAG